MARRKRGRRARPATQTELPGGSTRPPHPDAQAPGGGLGCHARGGAAGNGRPGATRWAAGAACYAWNGPSPSPVMIASGNLIRMEGIICSGSRRPRSIPMREIKPR